MYATTAPCSLSATMVFLSFKYHLYASLPVLCFRLENIGGQSFPFQQNFQMLILPWFDYNIFERILRFYFIML